MAATGSFVDETNPGYRHVLPIAKETIARIRHDYREIAQCPLAGIVVDNDEADLTLAHALVQGPNATPYADGFFYFRIRFPHNYPQEPPKVRFLTTGGGVVRFNPNLYANGKVCLSLLGTWHGPGWSPLNSLTSVLLSIQSIMGASPLHNEPGYEVGSSIVSEIKVQDYNDIVAHETMRCAVLGNVVDTHALPESLRDSMLASFSSLKDLYTERCESLGQRLDGKAFADPVWKQQGIFDFHKLKARILEAADKVESGELT